MPSRIENFSQLKYGEKDISSAFEPTKTSGFLDISGWWLTYPSEKYEFVSWDYEIPNLWKNKILLITIKSQ
jgi:hypothetical protein